MSLGPIYDEVAEWYSRKQLGARRLDVLGGTLGSDFYVLEGMLRVKLYGNVVNAPI